MNSLWEQTCGIPDFSFYSFEPLKLYLPWRKEEDCTKCKKDMRVFCTHDLKNHTIHTLRYSVRTQMGDSGAFELINNENGQLLLEEHASKYPELDWTYRKLPLVFDFRGRASNNFSHSYLSEIKILDRKYVLVYTYKALLKFFPLFGEGKISIFNMKGEELISRYCNNYLFAINRYDEYIELLAIFFDSRYHHYLCSVGYRG